jgi:hypothetical protein
MVVRWCFFAYSCSSDQSRRPSSQATYEGFQVYLCDHRLPRRKTKTACC